MEAVTDINTEEETLAVSQALENGLVLSLDAKEMVQLLDDAISDTENATKPVDIVPGQSVLDKLTQEKLEKEVENLKLDSEYRRAQIDALKNGTDGRKSTVKLPRIYLPEFSGKSTDWPSFWDSYKATIHGNATLSKVDKFKYLLSCLRDEAKETLSGFNIGEAQYDQAVKLLEECVHGDFLIAFSRTFLLDSWD